MRRISVRKKDIDYEKLVNDGILIKPKIRESKYIWDEGIDIPICSVIILNEEEKDKLNKKGDE